MTLCYKVCLHDEFESPSYLELCYVSHDISIILYGEKDEHLVFKYIKRYILSRERTSVGLVTMD